MKRILAITLVVVMTIGMAPLSGFVGLELPEFGMEASAATITSYRQGDIVEFGWYPQSEVTDNSIISELNSLSGDNKLWTSYGYYSGTGNYADGQMKPGDYMRYKDIVYGSNKYRGVIFDSYRPMNTGYMESNSYSLYQYDNGYYKGVVYWFKYEPIKWRLLDPNTGMLITEKVLDSQAYNNYILSNWGDVSKEYYCNNYKKSSIREWLKKNFYNTAFSIAQQNIIEYTALDNTAYDEAYSVYDSETTYDKVYLLSWDDVLNEKYGFSSSCNEDTFRMVQGSDYAECQGLWVYTNEKNNIENARWYLRSAGYYSQGGIAGSCGVREKGELHNNWWSNGTGLGIRPAININITSEIFQSDVKDVGKSSADGTIIPETYLASWYIEENVIWTTTAVDVGNAIPVPDAPTKDGYKFVGWFDENGNEVPEKMPAKDMIFYAKFVEEKKEQLTVEIIPEKTVYNYINGALKDNSGKSYSSVNATVSIKNNSTNQEIKNLTLDFLVTYPTIGGLSFSKTEEKYDYSITVDSLKPNESKEIKLTLYPCDNNLSSITKITADITIGEEYYDYFESEEIKLNYKINHRDEVYKFNNHQDWFVGSSEKDKYLISSESMKKVSLIDKTNIYINSLKNWNGSCYGMSSMLAAFEHGWSSASDYGASTVKKLSAPINNIKLRDAINIMQSSQTTLRFIGETFDDVNFLKQTVLRKRLVDSVKNISNGGNVILLGIQDGLFKGHAVVAYNVIEKGNDYKVSIADPNYPELCGTVTVSKDYSKFSYDIYPELKEIKFVITNKDILDINSYLSDSLTTSAVEEKYDFTNIILSDFDEVTIENKIGQKAIISYVTGTVEGDLEVYVSTIAGAETGTVSVVIPDNADEINEYKITSSNGMTATINNNHVIADLKTTNDATVDYSSDGFVGITGLNNSEYSLSLTDGINIESTEMLLNTVSGNNADTVEMKLVDNSIEILSDNLSDSKLTIVKNDNELSEESYDFEEDSVVVKSNNGEITIGKNENNNNDDDDNDVVPPIANAVATIRTPSTTTINYGDSIWLHAEISGELPAGAKIIWTPSNNNFEIVEVSADGLSCKITSTSNGTTTFTVSVVDANEKVLATDTQDMNSKAGLWQKIVAFFKKIFGATKTYPELFKSLF